MYLPDLMPLMLLGGLLLLLLCLTTWGMALFDILRRSDLSKPLKSYWIKIIIFTFILGALIYWVSYFIPEGPVSMHSRARSKFNQMPLKQEEGFQQTQSQRYSDYEKPEALYPEQY